MPVGPHVRTLYQRVPKSERRCREFVRHGWVYAWVVSRVEPAGIQLEVEQMAHFLAQHDREELPVGDVLEHGSDDSPSFLVQFLVAPVRVDVRELGCDLVVLVDPDHVEHQQSRLFATSGIPGANALVGECRPEADVFAGRSPSEQEQPVSEDSCVVGGSRVAGVDGRGVDVRGDLVGLLAPR